MSGINEARPGAAPHVIVVGSLHLDIVVDAPRLPGLDETLAGSAWRQVFGGKGGNQAAASARMGAPTGLIGRVGADRFGDTLMAALDEAGVDRRAVAVDPTNGSGMSVAILDAKGDYGAVIVSGANLAIPPDTTANTVGHAAPRVLLLQNEVPEAVNRAAARAGRAAAARVIWNAAPYRPDTVGLLEDIDILVVNRVEAAGLAGHSVKSADEALTVANGLARPGRDVIVTLGGDGLVFASVQGSGTIPAFATRVVSTHGAGDMFVGALGARLADGATLADALEFAAAAASLQVGATLTERAALTPAAVWARIKDTTDAEGH